jgi:signal transduction histidine kinase/CheY-like chemotaxis protein
MEKPLRILHLEDSPGDAELVKATLEADDIPCHVVRAATRAEFLSALEQGNFDLILADYSLPQFDGGAALAIAREKYPSLPFILVSGSIGEETAVESLRRGATDYVIKNRLSRLPSRVRRAMREAEERARRARSEEALLVRVQELEILREVSQTVLNSPDLKTTLDSVLDKTLALGGFEVGIFRLVDPATKILPAVSVRGFKDSANVNLKSADPQSAAVSHAVTQAMSRKDAYVIEDVPRHPGLRALKKEAIQSAIILPVWAAEKVLGAIQLGSRQPRKFHPDEIHLLETLASQMGLAVQKALLLEEADRRRKHAEAVREIGLTLTSTHDPQQVLERVAEEARRLVNAMFAYVVTPAKPFYRFAAVAGDDRGYKNVLKLSDDPASPYGGGPLGRAIRALRPAICEDVQNDPLFRAWSDIASKHGIHSLVAVPIVVQEKPYGALITYAPVTRAYDNETINLLSSLAAQAGVALENAHLFQETQRSLERFRALHEIEMAITSTLDRRAVLNILLEKIELSLPYAAATVRLYNKESGLLEPEACRNLDEKEWRAGDWRGGRGSANLVFETKAPMTVLNISADPRVHDRPFFSKYELVSFLGVPLISKGECLGVLSVYTRAEHEFAPDEVEYLTALAGQAAIAIDNAQLYERSKRQAIDLAKSNRVKDEFLSVMSHELRTPLNVVMGYAGMMRDGILGPVSPEQESALEKVLNRANDQLTMVNSILYATSIETQKIPVRYEPISLKAFFDELRAGYGLPGDKPLAFRWDYPADAPPILTDPDKLKHILQNLINNAVKFTDEGSITITARLGSRNQESGIGAAPQPPIPNPKSLTPNSRRWVEVEVKDTGVGIPAEQLSRIFDKFHQVDSSETRLFSGIGLGLYLVKQFTELLKGTVEVESELDKGTTFTVTIPIPLS